jgi:hypothetical protein
MKNVFKNLLFGFILIIGLGLMNACTTESTSLSKDSFFDHLDKEQIVKLQIESNFSELINNRNQKMKQEALLTLKNGSGVSMDYSIQISLRGKTRREVCAFPPLKLKLDETLLKAQGLNEDFDKYKLVTHCMEDSESVLKEYLAYQLYNQLTDYSFRVRLVELTYIDCSGGMEITEQYGILIENYKEMAERLDAQKMPDQLPKNIRIPTEDYQRLALFQYMIGNTDWNLHKQHNIKWLRTKDAAIPVPYDFDYSGLVNASYAKPHPSLPIDNVRERFLQYRGDDLQDLESMRATLHQKQAELIRLCTQFQALSAPEKQDMTTYLNEFFSMSGQANYSAKPAKVLRKS